ncbi:MAG TPA: hypothetical protein VMT63_01305 [Bacteroidales bacterium]|nr:hypothetical protein [Bacteroidales bacterium]
MKKVTLAGILITFLLFLYVCKPVEKMPARPSITFKSFQTFDTIDTLGNNIRAGRLKFYFQDGDGDLGLKPPQTSGDDSTNMFFKLYRVKNKALVPASDNDPLKPSDYRIPYLSTIGQNVFLRGTISVTFLYWFYENSDTILYNFCIKDRAGNISDTATTCEIPIIRDTICKGN